MKVGLEVHQQLATGKLFCACPTELSETVTGTLERRLRATGGENLAVDPAAAFEAARGRSFEYETTPSDCLVEADEEPPHALNPEALAVGLTVAALLHARPLDEVEVMRKIVIDGSNTSGFQRTALLAVDGHVEVGGRRYSIPTICLEEDSARKVSEGAGTGRFRLDRLGIPLLEIATAPEITGGAEARAVASEIGAILRATKRVRRGIGTIREDLNVSTPGGTRVEIKGVQELRLIQTYVETEERRQKWLLTVQEGLRARHPLAPPESSVDVAPLLAGISSGPFRDLAGRHAVALALPMPGFAGLLGNPAGENERLGRELADYARAAGLRGLVHSDELPNYGITAEHVVTVRRQLALAADDGFVVVTAPDRSLAEAALGKVRQRALAAFEGVPPETRDPLPDGRTRYSRPLPGRDRMYPETDIPPVPTEGSGPVGLPEMPTATRERIAAAFDLNPELVRQIQQEDGLDRFETLVRRGHPAGSVARILTQDLAQAEAGAGPTGHAPTDAELDAVLVALREGRFAKEGLPEVLRRLVEGKGDVETAIRAAGLQPLGPDELVDLARSLVRENASIIHDRGERAISALMGDLMRIVRGRRDGQEVARVLAEAVRAQIAASRNPSGS